MKPIPTWRETLGNSPTLVAAGAVGQAMQQEIDVLRTRLAEVERKDALLRDAARYRWLRTNCISDVQESMNGPGHKQLMFIGKIYPDWRFAIDHIGLDAAIDAAMGAQA